MKKESIIAVFLGIAMGTAIALTLVAVTKKNQKTNKAIVTSPKVAVALSTTKTPEAFEISTPQSGEITTDKKIAIKGKASKESLIIVQSALGEQVVEPKSDTFEIPIQLKPGENVVRVTAYTNSTSQEKSLKIYQLSE